MPRSALTWFLGGILLGLLFLVSGCASVQTREPVAVHRDSNVAVTLFDEPCSSPKVLRFIPPPIVGDFRSASVLWQGKTLDACWAQLDDGSMIVDETGDSGFIPVKGQKRV